MQLKYHFKRTHPLNQTRACILRVSGYVPELCTPNGPANGHRKKSWCRLPCFDCVQNDKRHAGAESDGVGSDSAFHGGDTLGRHWSSRSRSCVPLRRQDEIRRSMRPMCLERAVHRWILLPVCGHSPCTACTRLLAPPLRLTPAAAGAQPGLRRRHTHLRFMKKCVPSSSTPCSTPTASCRPTCFAVECTTCANADYPAKWVDCGTANPPAATPAPSTTANPPAATPAPSTINVQGTPPAVTPATIDAPAKPAAKSSAYLCGGKTKFVAQCGNCVSSEQCAIGFCCPYVATPSSATRPALRALRWPLSACVPGL